MLREQARAQKVSDKQQAAPQQVSTQTTPTSFLAFEVQASYNKTAVTMGGLPVITQEADSPQAAASCKHMSATSDTKLTQDYMFCMMEVPGYKAPFTGAQAASCKYPLQFLCNFTYSDLDNDTGNLLEYCHLIKHHKYKNMWKKSFGKEIICLATTTETIFIMNKK